MDVQEELDRVPCCILYTPYCHDLAKTAKSLFIFTLLYFFFWTYYTGRSVGKCHITQVSQSHDGSHDECGKIVHRPCSSCISSIQKIMETPLSSSC